MKLFWLDVDSPATLYIYTSVYSLVTVQRMQMTRLVLVVLVVAW
jgi:hypothetical protein